jgi:cytochrome c-type biogenesis protein CcmH
VTTGSRRRFPLWTLLGVVLVVALVIGSGVFRSGAPTSAQRAYAIESVVRCPSCEDLSVADSTAETAVTVRAAVVRQLAQGRTNQQIEDYLVARYGSSIVLDPPASGWSLLVWLLPILGGLIAVTALVVVLVRRRRAAGRGDLDLDPGSDRGLGLGPAALEDRRSFLDRSLADADAEFLAGDLSDVDYLALRRRDMARLTALDRMAADRSGRSMAGAVAVAVAVDDPPRAGTQPIGHGDGDTPVSEPARPRSARARRSRWFLGGAVAAFAAALILIVSLSASNRAPGQSITGSVAQTASQQVEESLTQAATEESEGQIGPAAQLYQSVLTKHPGNEVAMAQLGWLEFETGQQGGSQSLISDARAKLNKAVQLDPTDFAARLYLGTVLLQQDGNAAGAVAQYRQFLADNPPASVVKQAASVLRQAYRQAGIPLPSSVPAS